MNYSASNKLQYSVGRAFLFSWAKCSLSWILLCGFQKLLEKTLEGIDPSFFSELVTWMNNLKPYDIVYLPYEGVDMPLQNITEQTKG